MKKIIIGTMIVLIATFPEAGNACQPCHPINPCYHNYCQPACVKSRDYVVARFTGTFWDPFSRKMVFAQMSVEPAEFLDVPPVSPIITSY